MPSTPPNATAHAPINREAFHATWGTEPEDNQTLLIEYAKTNAKDLLALKTAVETRHAQDILDYAHRMAGASQIMGATGVVSCCSALEKAARSGDWAAITAGVEALRHEIGAVHAYIDTIQTA